MKQKKQKKNKMTKKEIEIMRERINREIREKMALKENKETLKIASIEIEVRIMRGFVFPGDTRPKFKVVLQDVTVKDIELTLKNLGRVV